MVVFMTCLLCVQLDAGSEVNLSVTASKSSISTTSEHVVRMTRNDSGELSSSTIESDAEGAESPKRQLLKHEESPVNILPVALTTRFPRLEPCVVVALLVSSVLLAAATLALQV